MDFASTKGPSSLTRRAESSARTAPELLNVCRQSTPLHGMHAYYKSGCDSYRSMRPGCTLVCSTEQQTPWNLDCWTEHLTVCRPREQDDSERTWYGIRSLHPIPVEARQCSRQISEHCGPWPSLILFSLSRTLQCMS